MTSSIHKKLVMFCCSSEISQVNFSKPRNLPEPQFCIVESVKVDEITPSPTALCPLDVEPDPELGVAGHELEQRRQRGREHGPSRSGGRRGRRRRRGGDGRVLLRRLGPLRGRLRLLVDLGAGVGRQQLARLEEALAGGSGAPGGRRAPPARRADSDRPLRRQ